MPDTKSMIEEIYESITEVIGGSNPDQIFCMSFPGVSLDKESYEYDTNKTKPPTVRANESKLTNKLFDPCQVTGGDNGRQLATQYLSALDALTPKLNPNINKAKNILRELLESSYSYTLDNGTKFDGTLQQVFYRLYEEWILEKKKWNLVQYEKQEELNTKYSGGSEEDATNIRNEYLEWYEDVAESYLSAIEAKFGKVLGIFSVNDMKIIEGILDSGTGAELEEAKEQVRNVRKPNPDGGYVYPVTLEPANWFEYLSTDFDYVDLLKSPDAYLQQYTLLVQKRDSITDKISAFSAKDQSGNLEEAIKNLKDAKDNFYKADDTLGKTYSESAIKAAQMLCGLIKKSPAANPSAPTDPSTKTEDRVKNDATQNSIHALVNKDNSSTDKDIPWDDIKNIWDKTDDAQSKYVQASENLSDAAMQEIKAETMSFNSILQPLVEELKNVNKEIDDLKTKMDTVMTVDNSGSDFSKKLFPDKISKGFMQMTVSTEASSITKSSSLYSSASNSSMNANFFFGGYSQSSSSSSSVFNDFASSTDMKIQIGCLLTKVNIVRNWFNPGVFLLSRDMFNTSGCSVSNGGLDGVSDVKKQLMSMDDCIFPCYPTAMVIAKDVTINFEYANDISQTHKDVFQEHVSRGGGLFCFRGSSSSSSSDENSSACTKFNGKTMTIRFPGPQVLGYYLEFTPKDQSKPLFDAEAQQNVSIAQFVEDCRKMLSDTNTKDNK